MENARIHLQPARDSRARTWVRAARFLQIFRKFNPVACSLTVQNETGILNQFLNLILKQGSVKWTNTRLQTAHYVTMLSF